MLRIAAFRSAALHLLPPALERLTARHSWIRPEVRVVRARWRPAARTRPPPRRAPAGRRSPDC